MMSLAQRSAAALKQYQPNLKRRKTMYKIKPSMFAVYFSVFILIVSLISLGYRQPENASTVANAANVAFDSKTNQTSVDEAIATSVASGVAQATNLPVAESVANLAVSAKIQSDLSQSDGISTSKPKIIESVAENRLVNSYTVVEGDNVNSLATKFGISAQTIKWANNLTTDTLSVGSTLKILPIDGVLYSVKANDTTDSISTKYGVDKIRLVVYNDLDVSGLKENTSIILPGANLPETERPGYVAPVVINYSTSFGTGFGGNTWYIKSGTPGYAGNTYAFGNCTRYAYDRRVELGLPVSSGWGHAYTWATAAAIKNGLVVDHTPSVGAIIQNGGNLGHVAIVESILPNGDLSISEMNAYVSGGGKNIVSGRIVIAGNVGQYMYIH